MPPNRPGRMKYVTATKACVHGQAVVESEHVGVAVKQKAPAWDAVPTAAANIAIGEQFAIIAKGIVEIPAVGGAVKGTLLWINITNNAVTTADPGAGNGRKFGKVAEVAGERGGRSTHIRVDLDDRN